MWPVVWKRREVPFLSHILWLAVESSNYTFSVLGRMFGEYKVNSIYFTLASQIQSEMWLTVMKKFDILFQCNLSCYLMMNNCKTMHSLAKYQHSTDNSTRTARSNCVPTVKYMQKPSINHMSLLKYMCCGDSFHR